MLKNEFYIRLAKLVGSDSRTLAILYPEIDQVKGSEVAERFPSPISNLAKVVDQMVYQHTAPGAGSMKVIDEMELSEG